METARADYKERLRAQRLRVRFEAGEADDG
jgi:hypothetical protein